MLTLILVIMLLVVLVVAVTICTCMHTKLKATPFTGLRLIHLRQRRQCQSASPNLQVHAPPKAGALRSTARPVMAEQFFVPSVPLIGHVDYPAIELYVTQWLASLPLACGCYKNTRCWEKGALRGLIRDYCALFGATLGLFLAILRLF